MYTESPRWRLTCTVSPILVTSNATLIEIHYIKKLMYVIYTWEEGEDIILTLEYEFSPFHGSFGYLG